MQGPRRTYDFKLNSCFSRLKTILEVIMVPGTSAPKSLAISIIKAQFISEAEVNSLSPESGFRHHFKKLALGIVLLCIVTKIF